MPALTASATSNNPAGKTPAASKVQPPKKMRVVRRRGRGPAGTGVDSDEEIEREAGSDMDSDAQSSLGSVSGDDDDSDHNDAEPHTITPSTTQSPPPHEADQLKPGQEASGPFKHSTGDWSEMVAAEDLSGESSLPVIDFADLGREPSDAPASSTSGQPTSAFTQAPEDHDEGVSHLPTASANGAPPRRPHVQNARLAYQEKLEKDPAFIPRIGEFWGHDDRLFDKDTRPLSNWWRGRGRGGVMNRGRGRGGMGGYARSGPGLGPDGANVETDAAEVLPVDRTWTHDGFEELRRRDEQRKQSHRGAIRGGRGSGTFGPGRGRGGFAQAGPIPLPQSTAGWSATPALPTDADTEASVGASLPALSSSAVPASSTAAAPFTGSASGSVPYKKSTPAPSVAPSPRVWYAMKPERLWTKQHEGFLYFDYTLKPRPGLGPGLRVRLPGGEGHIVRVAPYALRAPPMKLGTSSAYQVLASMPLIVRLPGNKVLTSPPTDRASASTDDAAVIATEATADRPSSVEPKAPQSEQTFTDFVAGPSASSLPTINVHLPKQLSQQPPRLTVDTAFSHVPVQQAPPALEEPQPAVAKEATPVFHPGAPVFNPSAQAAQTYQPYGVPYGYPPQLPPGIAIGHHGMPYEISSGRPVFVPGLLPQPTQPSFTPPVGMHGPPGPTPFVPGHMHHPSSMSMPGAPSPDFLAPHARPPPMATFIDPVTGRPLFTPARQSSRIEIRAPEDASHAGSPAQPPFRNPPSTGAMASAEQSEPPQPGTSAVASMSPPHPQPMYAPYPQPQFYYPEQHYGYQPYMPHHQPHPSYDMYANPEHTAPVGTVYYQ